MPVCVLVIAVLCQRISAKKYKALGKCAVYTYKSTLIRHWIVSLKLYINNMFFFLNSIITHVFMCICLIK